ncbi:MAG: hypothetical protein H7A23_22255 [Leptospiraceae bacterium]|nr:hypothetical protein [Leptospiraceae bacterium]MCP5497285.1 hypothetical protein [Leptospiraceae bacterium]
MNFSRKQFIHHCINTGLFLTVPEFLENCKTNTLSTRNYGQDGKDPIQNAESSGLRTPILKAINVGITAPNPHNTQAWKFRIINDKEMFLYVDEKRILPQTDPPARQIHIGQGTFLEHLKIGASVIGYKTQIALLPEGTYKFQEIGQKPIAKVVLEKDTNIKKDSLYDAVPNRATNRCKYEGEMIQKEEYAKILSLTKPKYSTLKFINDTNSLGTYKEKLKEAFTIETNTFAKHEESRIWFRYNDEEIYDKRDGISLRGNGLSGIKLWIVEKFFLTHGKEVWHSESNKKGGIDIFRDQVESTKALVLFKTIGNSLKDQVQVGMDYARFQLSVTSLDLVMHPMSQILQEYPEMNQLREELEKMEQIQSDEKIQMMVRLGRSDYQFLSPRRNPKSMILGT